LRRLVFIVLLFLSLALTSSGCSLWENNEKQPLPPAGDRPSESEQIRETVFYFPDKSGQFVVPVRFNIPWQEGIARATINCMIDGQVPPELLDHGLYPLLPVETEIRGLTIKDGSAFLDFNRAFLNYDPEYERQLIDGLVYTLTEFPTISEVEILVEGEKLTELPGGSPLSKPLDRDRGVNLSVSDDVHDLSNTDKVKLYFLYSAGESVFYVPVTRVVCPGDDKISMTVQELLRGPASSSSFFSAIPRGVTLESISMNENELTLRLKGALTATGGGQMASDQIRDQLALTLTEFTNITKIKVLIDGQVPQFPGGVSFPETFGRPDAWNQVTSISQ